MAKIAMGIVAMKIQSHVLQRFINQSLASGLLVMTLVISLAGCGWHTSDFYSNRSSEAEQYIAKGFEHYEKHQDEEALRFYRKALLTTGETTEPSQKADIYYRIGNVLFRQQNYEQSLVSYQKALTFLQEKGTAEDVRLVRNSLGIVYQILGQIEAAREQFLLTLAIRRELGDQSGEVRALINLGSTYLSQGRYPEALDYYTKAKELSETGAPQQTRNSGAVLTHMGALYSELGQYDKALELHQKGLELYEKESNKKGMATALHNIGYLQSEQKNYSAAIVSYYKSLSVRSDQDLHGKANTLNNLGLTLADAGQMSTALDKLFEALQIHENLHVPKNVAATLDSIGSVYTKQREYSRALDYYTQSLVIERRLGDREGERITLGNIGQMLEQENKLSSSIVFYKMAINLTQEMRSELTTLPQKEQRAYAARIEANYRRLADLLISRGRLAEAEQVLTMLKEEEYFLFIRRRSDSAETVSTRAAYSKVEQPWTARYEEINKRLIAIGQDYEELIAGRTKGLSEEETLRLEQLKLDMKIARKSFRSSIAELEVFFASQLPQRAMEFGAKELKTLRQIQPELVNLGPGTLLVTILVTDKRLRFLLTTASQQVHRDSNIPKEELNRLIAAFRVTLQNPQSDPTNQAKVLYDYLVEPIAEDLEQASAQTLLLSLDDTLRYLPFSALYDGKQYLGEKYDLVIYTAAARRHLTTQPSASWRIAGLGVSERTGSDFNALPAVRQELDSIVQEEETEDLSGVFPGVVRLNTQFTSDQLSDDLRQGFPVIHIASHFKFRPGNESNSFLVLGAGQTLSLGDLQDGDYSLTAVDLLTLSACETAYGGRDADGREVESFGVLAQQLGAKAVLATLWPVEDNGTADFMASFYQLRQQGMTKAKALRMTQKSFLNEDVNIKDVKNQEDATEERGAIPVDSNGVVSSSGFSGTYSHPFYWAPFILMGNYL